MSKQEEDVRKGKKAESLIADEAFSTALLKMENDAVWFWKDKLTELVWLPQTINEPKQGMIFANGTNAKEWKWSAVKAVPVTEEEKYKFPIPKQPGKFYEYRMDMGTLQHFEERDFMEALSYIGLLP